MPLTFSFHFSDQDRSGFAAFATPVPSKSPQSRPLPPRRRRWPATREAAQRGRPGSGCPWKMFEPPAVSVSTISNEPLVPTVADGHMQFLPNGRIAAGQVVADANHQGRARNRSR